MSATRKNRHTCHLPGCETPCPPSHLFCRKHWAMVPKDLQAEVYNTVSQRGRYVDATWAPWWRAQASATAEVMKLLGRDRARIAAWLEKEFAFAETLEARES